MKDTEQSFIRQIQDKALVVFLICKVILITLQILEEYD